MSDKRRDRKPKCPWKPPFFVHTLNGMGGDDPGAVELHDQRGGITIDKTLMIFNPWEEAKEKLDALCYALNLAYPAKGKPKGRKK